MQEMFRTIAGIVVLLAPLASFSEAREKVVRQVEPWWTSNSVAAVAAQRRRNIDPAAWTEEEAAWRTVSLAHTNG